MQLQIGQVGVAAHVRNLVSSVSTQEKAREEREEASFSKPAGSRGSSAHSTTSMKSKASKHTPSAHSRASTAERKSKSVTPKQSRASSTHSRRTSSQQSQGEAISERKEGSIGRSSKQSTPNRSRPSTAPGSGIRSKEASWVQSRASSAASSTKLSRHQLEDGGSERQSLSTAELRVGAIRRDLHK